MRNIFFLFILLSSTLFSQEVDWDQIVAPQDVANLPLEEKLVQLAWNNLPSNDLLYDQVIAAEKEITLAKWSWLDDIGVSFNFNQRNFNEGFDYQEGQNQFFPWYNIGVNVNLGNFISIPAKTSIAIANHSAAQKTVMQAKITIRAEVLRRYEAYRASLEFLKLQTQAVEEIRSSHLLITQQFKNGEIPLDVYSESAARFTQTMEQRMAMESQVRIAKIAVEEMIGVPLETIATEDEEGE